MKLKEHTRDAPRRDSTLLRSERSHSSGTRATPPKRQICLKGSTHAYARQSRSTPIPARRSAAQIHRLDMPSAAQRASQFPALAASAGREDQRSTSAGGGKTNAPRRCSGTRRAICAISVLDPCSIATIKPAGHGENAPDAPDEMGQARLSLGLHLQILSGSYASQQ
jgi:hypothetical protein